MLELRDLCVDVEGRVLVRGLDLSASPGERVGVLGPSGSGKTTLLRAVAGLVDARAGQVRLDGRSGDEMGWPAWRRRVTYVAQQPVMTAGTVRANLDRPFHYGLSGRRLDEGKARARLVRLRLAADVIDQEARTLSVGQKQRVSLVRALGIEPHVLLLDEPTSGLDEDAARALEDLVREWTETGGAALVVTHDRAQAERWCTRTVDLQDHVAAPPGADARPRVGSVGGAGHA